MQEYDIDELLENIENENTKAETFAQTLAYFSTKPKEFRQGFMYYEDNDVRWDIYNKLFKFLPLTKDIVNSIANEDFSDEDDLIHEGEELFVKEYFKSLEKYREFLEKNSINVEDLNLKFKGVELKYKEYKEENKRLTKSKNAKNLAIKERSDLMMELNIEKIERIDKMKSKVERYSDKLESLVKGRE